MLLLLVLCALGAASHSEPVRLAALLVVAGCLVTTATRLQTLLAAGCPKGLLQHLPCVFAVQRLSGCALPCYAALQVLWQRLQ